MKKAIFWLGVTLTVALISAACAPAAAPAPSPAPAPQAAPAAPALTPEEAVWAQVVAAAKKETKVVVYDYFLVGDVGLRMSKAFEKRYGIKVEAITGRGAEFLERLKTEKRIGRIVADALSSSASHTINLKEAGLTASTASQLPELRESKVWAIDPRHFDPEGHVLGINNTSYNAYVNTTLVTPDEWPKSLQDLMDPRWKGKILALDPTVSTGFYNYFVPLLNRGLLDQDYLKALGEQKLLFKLSGLDAAAALARGGVDLGIGLEQLEECTEYKL